MILIIPLCRSFSLCVWFSLCLLKSKCDRRKNMSLVLSLLLICYQQRHVPSDGDIGGVREGSEGRDTPIIHPDCEISVIKNLISRKLQKIVQYRTRNLTNHIQMLYPLL